MHSKIEGFGHCVNFAFDDDFLVDFAIAFVTLECNCLITRFNIFDLKNRDILLLIQLVLMKWITYLSKILFGSVFPALLSQAINGKSHDVIDKSDNFEKAQNHIDYSHFLIRSFILKRIEIVEK